MILLLMGPPGAGKGTQAAMLAKETSLPHVSTGDLFRNLDERTEMGKRAASAIARGELVPDDLTFEVLSKRLAEKDCAKGFILDGYPRTLKQAKDFEKWLKARKKKIDFVFCLDLPVVEAVQRLSTRLTCESCGKVYNTQSSPNAKNCVCGGELYRRDDQDPEAVRKRFSEYEEKTAPLLAYYGGKLIKVDSSRSAEETFKQLRGALKK